MVALFSPPQLSCLGWLLEDPISHELENMNYFCGDDNKTLTPDSINHLHQTKNDDFTSFNEGLLVYGGDEGKMVTKKLNHNASERDRRKKINTLYSTLRSLLPHEDQLRKQSIPTTVSKVVSYIPELQQQVERLSKKKENLIMMMSSSNIINSEVDEEPFGPKNKKIKSNQSTLTSSVVSATPISDREIVFHITMPKTDRRSISEVVMRLENEGFIVINTSCFESFDGMVFYSLHLQAQGSQVPMDAEMLKKIVLERVEIVPNMNPFTSFT